MNPLPAFLQPLEYDNPEAFPAEAVNEAFQRREEAIPFLLNSLEWICEHPYAENEEGNVYELHIFALFLLAAFREPRAYPLVLRIFLHPEADAIVGDLTEEIGERILASVCGSQDAGPIEQAIENPELDELVRATLVSCLGLLSHSGVKPREEVVAYFRRLFHGHLEIEAGMLWNCFLEVCIDFRMVELLPEIRGLYQENAENMDTVGVEPLPEVELQIARPFEPAARYSLIGDPAIEILAWQNMGEEIDEDFE